MGRTIRILPNITSFTINAIEYRCFTYINYWKKYIYIIIITIIICCMLCISFTSSTICCIHWRVQHNTHVFACISVIFCCTFQANVACTLKISTNKYQEMLGCRAFVFLLYHTDFHCARWTSSSPVPFL